MGRESNFQLELESARLARENELLRAQLVLSCASAGPPGVWMPPAITTAATLNGPPGVNVPPGVWSTGMLVDSWASSQVPPGVWAPPSIGACEKGTCSDDDSESDDSTQIASTSETDEVASSSVSQRSSSFSDA